MKISLAIMGVLVFVLAACAYQSQVVRLAPVTGAVAGADLSRGDIALRVRDNRSTSVIGKRASGSMSEANISTGPDVVDSLQKAVIEILQSKGLRIVDSDNPSSRKLDVELHELKYESLSIKAEQKVRVVARLWLYARNGTQKLEKSYEASQERKIIIEPIAKSNEEWINETLSDAFKQMAKDPKLDAFFSVQ